MGLVVFAEHPSLVKKYLYSIFEHAEDFLDFALQKLEN